MPDLAVALAGMFSGGDVSIVQARTTAIGQGVATVDINGGEFTDVPYMMANYGGGQQFPSNNQTVYVIARRNWGMLIIGAPAPGPTRSVSSGTAILWPPSVLANYHLAGSWWEVSSDDQMSINGTDNWAVEIFSNTDRPALPATGLSGAGFEINVLSAESGGFMSGGAYMTAGLFTNPAPSGALVTIADAGEQHFYRDINDPIYMPIPLDWASRLVAGTAKGIYVHLDGEYDYATITLGELQLTFL